MHLNLQLQFMHQFYLLVEKIITEKSSKPIERRGGARVGASGRLPRLTSLARPSYSAVPCTQAAVRGGALIDFLRVNCRVTFYGWQSKLQPIDWDL